MKLIVILRNPIDKTHSDWKHNYGMGYETVTNFRKALSLIDERKKENCVPYFDYLEKGLFASHLERYLNYFKRTQLKIVFFDDFKIDPNKSCNEIIDFLGINEPFEFDTKKIHMKAKTLYKSYQLNRASNFLSRHVSTKIKKFIDYFNEIDQHLNKVDKAFLVDYFTDDIKKLEEIAQRDLSNWYKIDS